LKKKKSMQTATNLTKIVACLSPKLQDYQAKFLNSLSSPKIFDMHAMTVISGRHSKSFALWSYVLCRAAQSGEVEIVFSAEGATSLAALLRGLGFEAKAYGTFVRGRIASGKFSLKVKTL
jgi:hypothetical protein